MTNLSSSANMGWEVAGGKKINSKKTLDVKTKAGKDAAVSKIPRLEGLRKFERLKFCCFLFKLSFFCLRFLKNHLKWKNQFMI